MNSNVWYSLMYDATMDGHFTNEVFYGAVLGITIYFILFYFNICMIDKKYNEYYAPH